METVEALRAKANEYMAISEEHRAKMLAYEDRASQGAQEQLYLFGVFYGRASVYYQLALDAEVER